MHIRHIKSRKWKVIDSPQKFNGHHVEGLTIVTKDGKAEVVGCSEWMRSTREIFDHIVELHNATIK